MSIKTEQRNYRFYIFLVQLTHSSILIIYYYPSSNLFSVIIIFLCFIYLIICFSNVPNTASFQHMARMMDSLILNEFPPYTFTKITTTHRPTRANNGISTTSKLLTKSTANIPNMMKQNINNNNVASTLGFGNGIRQNLQKSKVPTQGRIFSILFVSFDDLFFYSANLFSLSVNSFF